MKIIIREHKYIINMISLHRQPCIQQFIKQLTSAVPFVTIQRTACYARAHACVRVWVLRGHICTCVLYIFMIHICIYVHLTMYIINISTVIDFGNGPVESSMSHYVREELSGGPSVLTSALELSAVLLLFSGLEVTRLFISSLSSRCQSCSRSFSLICSLKCNSNC